MTKKPMASPAAAGSSAMKLLDLQDMIKDMHAAVHGLTAEQLDCLDWGDFGSLSHGAEKASELRDWLTAWRAAQ